MDEKRRELNLRQVERIRDALGGPRPALILTHDNPDPDALASARGLQFPSREPTDSGAASPMAGWWVEERTA